MDDEDPADDKAEERRLGTHARLCRKARGLTQDALAERSGLAVDTIRRLEHGSFSPSLDTLRKLGAGLDIQLSTLFESFELGERNEHRELIDLVVSRSLGDVRLAARVLRVLFDSLESLRAQA